MFFQDRVTQMMDQLQITGVSYRLHTKAKHIPSAPMMNPILANRGVPLRLTKRETMLKIRVIGDIAMNFARQISKVSYDL